MDSKSSSSSAIEIFLKFIGIFIIEVHAMSNANVEAYQEMSVLLRWTIVRAFEMTWTSFWVAEFCHSVPA